MIYAPVPIMSQSAHRLAVPKKKILTAAPKLD